VNLAAVLEASGKALADVVRVGVYLTDMSNFAAMNKIYAKHFAEPYPARTTIGVLLNRRCLSRPVWRALNSGSHKTLRWRRQDSNPRSPERQARLKPAR